MAQNELEIDKLKSKNTNIYLGAGGISLLGNVGGLIYAIQTKKSGWGKVGWFFLGGIIVGIPAGIIGRSMMTKNNNKIAELKTLATTTDEEKENLHFEKGGGFNFSGEKPSY